MSDKLDDHRQHASPPPGEEFISYAAMIDALALQFPLVPLARIETIAREEHAIINGGGAASGASPGAHRHAGAPRTVGVAHCVRREARGLECMHEQR